jgi:hypothetical protein
MRQIGRVFGPAKILRTTDHIGAEGAFEDGAKLAGAISHVELYKPSTIQEWSVNLLIQKDPKFAELGRRFQLRAAACVSAVMGIDGQSPVTEMIAWLCPEYRIPQYWAADIAQENGIPVHNLADPDVFQTWLSWAREHTPNTTPVHSEDSVS